MATEAFWRNEGALRQWLMAADTEGTPATCEANHDHCALQPGGACSVRVRAVLRVGAAAA